MFVLSKKRLILITSCIFISIFTYMLSIQKNEAIQTVSLPVSNKVVVLDAGHRWGRFWSRI